MIDGAIDISMQIGWDTITDLELAHRFIEEKGLAHEFVGFLLGIKQHDEQQLSEDVETGCAYDDMDSIEREEQNRMLRKFSPPSDSEGDCC
jgi:hypothetical protein